MPDYILRLRGACGLALALTMVAACQATHGTEVASKQQNAAAYDAPQQIPLDGSRKTYWFFPRSMMDAFDAEFARLEDKSLWGAADINTCREWDNGKWHDEFVKAWNEGTIDRCQAMRNSYMQCEFAMRHSFFGSSQTNWFESLYKVAAEEKNEGKYEFSSDYRSKERLDGIDFISASVEIRYAELVSKNLEKIKSLEEKNQPVPKELEQMPTSYFYDYYLLKCRFDEENEKCVPIGANNSEEAHGVVVHRLAYRQLDASTQVLRNPKFEGAEELLLIGAEADYESHRDVAVATCEQINSETNTPTEAIPEGTENPLL